jgi:toxin HigB-1
MLREAPCASRLVFDALSYSAYNWSMIRSFADADTEKVFRREPVKRFSPELQRRALRSLGLIHAAITLDDLRTPPGNRLEPLKGSRAGQHSIRINDQWRVCFVWREGNADDVEIVDYH